MCATFKVIIWQKADYIRFSYFAYALAIFIIGGVSAMLPSSQNLQIAILLMLILCAITGILSTLEFYTSILKMKKPEQVLG